MEKKIGYMATIYTAARCEHDRRMDIYRLDEVWPTPEQVIDRLTSVREKLLRTFDRFECREYYSRLEDEPDECKQTFDKMIGELRGKLARWNARTDVAGPVEIDEEFEDISVRIYPVEVFS
jgi:hypothetical protein